MSDDKTLSYEAKLIIASNLAVAKAILRAHYGTTSPAMPIEQTVRGFLIGAAADLEGIEKEVDDQIARNAKKAAK